jgi:hypothetical protein
MGKHFPDGNLQFNRCFKPIWTNGKPLGMRLSSLMPTASINRPKKVASGESAGHMASRSEEALETR